MHGECQQRRLFCIFWKCVKWSLLLFYYSQCQKQHRSSLLKKHTSRSFFLVWFFSCKSSATLSLRILIKNTNLNVKIFTRCYKKAWSILASKKSVVGMLMLWSHILCASWVFSYFCFSFAKGQRFLKSFAFFLEK